MKTFKEMMENKALTEATSLADEALGHVKKAGIDAKVDTVILVKSSADVTKVRRALWDAGEKKYLPLVVIRDPKAGGRR